MGTHPATVVAAALDIEGDWRPQRSCALLCSPGRGVDGTQSTYCGEKVHLKIKCLPQKWVEGSGVKARVPLFYG